MVEVTRSALPAGVYCWWLRRAWHANVKAASGTNGVTFGYFKLET